MEDNSNKALILVAVVGLGFFLWLKAKDLSNKISFGAPRFGAALFTWLTSQINVFIPVINESGITAPVDDFTGVLLYGNQKIADLKLVEPVQIPGAGNVDLEIKAINKNVDLIGSILQIIGSKQLNEPLKIVGSLKVGKLNIPIDEPIEI